MNCATRTGSMSNVPEAEGFRGRGHLQVEKVRICLMEKLLPLSFFCSAPTQHSSEWRRCRFGSDKKPRDRVTTPPLKHHATRTMANAYQLSAERPHISLSPGDEIAEFHCLQTPITTFTALLNAAQSVETDTSAVKKCDAAPEADYSVVQRRLRNRVSCRKTRLKRKLNQHALELLARDRQGRHEYLTQLAHELGVDGSDDVQIPGSSHQDELFRELTANSLHYALVDKEYHGWLDDGSDQVITADTTEMTQDSDVTADDLPTRRPKRLRRARDSDVSTAAESDSASPQASLYEQWRLIADGLQNVDLKLYRMKESDLGASVFDRLCYWRFVAVNSAKVQQDGEIAAVAVSGTTRLTFHGRHVQEVNISTSRREYGVQYDCDSGHSCHHGDEKEPN